MAQSDPTLPILRTLSMLPLRDADMLLSFAERLYCTQATSEARWALRRIDTYRHLLGLPPSISSMERLAIKSTQRGGTARPAGRQTAGTARNSAVERYNLARQRLAG